MRRSHVPLDTWLCAMGHIMVDPKPGREFIQECLQIDRMAQLLSAPATELGDDGDGDRTAREVQERRQQRNETLRQTNTAYQRLVRLRDLAKNHQPCTDIPRREWWDSVQALFTVTNAGLILKPGDDYITWYCGFCQALRPVHEAVSSGEAEKGKGKRKSGHPGFPKTHKQRMWGLSDAGIMPKQIAEFVNSEYSTTYTPRQVSDQLKPSVRKSVEK